MNRPQGRSGGKPRSMRSGWARLYVQALEDRSHPAWLALRQLGVRGITALKFVLGARLLGPGAIGMVGVALLALAVTEAMSDTGLAEAVVQRVQPLQRDEAGAVWTLQLARGVGLGALLAALSPWICSYFRVPQAQPLVLLAALTLLPRNAINPGYILAHRARDFRTLAWVSLAAGTLDLAVGIGAVIAGSGAIGLLLGTLLDDVCILLVSWTIFRMALAPNLRWRSIASLTGFGKWVWSTSVLTLLVHQMDKVVIARLLGPIELGLYQVAQKLAQLVLVDTAGLFGQYLYPTLAQINRRSAAAARSYMGALLRRYAPGMVLAAGLLSFLAGPLVALTFGPRWSAAAPMLRLLAGYGLANGLLIVLVVYVRAIGHPRWVSHAALLQLLVMSAAMAPLYLALALSGVALALIVATSSAVLALAWAAWRHVPAGEPAAGPG